MHPQAHITLAPLLVVQAPLLDLERVRIPPLLKSPLILVVQELLLDLELVHNTLALLMVAQAPPLVLELPVRILLPPESPPILEAEPVEE